MYSRISACKLGIDSLIYAAGSGRGHNGHKERNLRVITVNMIPNGRYGEQMAVFWKRARKNHKIQTRRIVLSYSLNELDPNNKADLDIAEQIAVEFVQRFYEDRQAAIFMQADGKGGKLHLHIIVNDVSITDHKGCKKSQCHRNYVRFNAEAVARQYITLDSGKKGKVRRTQAERTKVEQAAEIRQQNPMLTHEQYVAELIRRKKYSYKEDMRYIIGLAKARVKNEEEFFEELRKHGIETERVTSPKYGEQYRYTFTGCPVKVLKNTVRSYKLGDDFTPEALQAYWEGKEVTEEQEHIVTDSEPTPELPKAKPDSDVDEKLEFLKNTNIKSEKQKQNANQQKIVNMDMAKLQQLINKSDELIYKLDNRIASIEQGNKRSDQAQKEFNIDKSKKQKQRSL